MLRWLDLRERMVAFGLYMEWRDGIEAREGQDEGEPSDEVVVGKRTRLRRTWQVPDPSKDNVDYKLAKRPHSPSKPLADVISANQLPSFLIDLQAYLTQKGVPGIPNHFAYLDIWTHIHLLLLIPNDFLKAEWRKVRANPTENTYDTVLINDGDADVVGLSGYSVGEVRLIFRPSNPLPHSPHPGPSPTFLAYVYMFSPIPRHKDPATQFFKISKDYLGQTRRGRVVELDMLIRPCPLAPVIEGPADIGDVREGASSLDNYHHFYINSFASLNDYICLR